MRPRFSVNAQVELDQISLVLQQADQARRVDTAPIRRSARTRLNPWLCLYLSLLGLGLWCAWSLADTFARGLIFTAGTPADAVQPVQEVQYVYLGQKMTVHSPDGRLWDATYRGDLANEADLPKSGNQLLDMWQIKDHLWVWATDGRSTVPTWIDP